MIRSKAALGSVVVVLVIMPLLPLITGHGLQPAVQLGAVSALLIGVVGSTLR